MNREVLDSWCERVILALVLSILVFAPLAMGATHLRDFVLVQALAALALFVWGLRLWLNRRPQLLWPPICWVALAFVGYAIARYSTAEIEYVARLELLRILVYAAIFFVIVNNLYRQEHSSAMAYVAVFLAMGISFYALYQFITKSNQVWIFTSPYQGRASGTFISPNNLAGFLEMILPLGLAWTLASRAGIVTRIITAYASLVIVAGIAVTISRGSWIAVVITLLLLFSTLCFHRPSRIPALALLAVMIGGAVFFIPRTHQFVQRFQQIYNRGVIDDNTRFALWRPAIEMWLDHPWCGVGPNHFNYRFREYRPEQVQLQPDRVHNDYINLLTDWGIVGMSLAVVAAASLAAGSFRSWKRLRASAGDGGGRRSNKLALILGAGFGLVAIGVHSVVDFNLHIPSNAILATSLVAILTTSVRFATDRYWFTPPVWAKAALTATLLLTVGYLAWQGRRCATEQSWLLQAQAAAEFSPERMAALEKAHAIEPRNFQTTHKIGEELRRLSWQFGDEQGALKAIEWFDRGIKLNPHDGYNHMRRGMCLDWLRRHDEAGPSFSRAVELDPHGYFTVAHMGWHFVQVGDYASARPWFVKSLRLQWKNNPIAETHLKLINERMLYAATNRSAINLDTLAR